MSISTLINVEEKLENQAILDDDKIKQLLIFLQKYKVNRIIYPGVITRELCINIEKTYQILGILTDESYLERNYEVYCNKCRKFNGTKIYRSLAAISEVICCDSCESDLNKLEDTILVYRVVKKIE